jgi:hypothetical protein
MLVVGAKQFSDHGERSDDVKRVISCVLALLMAVAPASSSAQQQIVSSTTEYLFGPDDIIEITVFGQPELTGEVWLGKFARRDVHRPVSVST